MREGSPGWFSKLLSPHRPPCVSIYQSVHRSAPPADEDPIRFRNLTEQAHEAMHDGYARRDVESVVGKLRTLLQDPSPWRGDRDGLAVFASPEDFRVLHLQQPVEQTVVVSDTFHVKPLIRILQQADRYHVLCLSQGHVALYEGNQYRLHEVELHNVPRSVVEAAATQVAQPGTAHRPASAPEARPPQTAGGPISGEPISSDVDRFFRAVDQGIWENYSRRHHLPLILAAVSHYHPRFHKISHNPYLLKEGIKLDPLHLPAERLCREAWQIMEPHYQRQLAQLREQFGTAKAQGKGSDDLGQTAQAVSQGRVGTLLVDADRRIPGRLERSSGQVQVGPAAGAHVDDLLDELAEMTLQKDGQVFVVPAQHMPTDTGLAAVYRF